MEEDVILFSMFVPENIYVLRDFYNTGNFWNGGDGLDECPINAESNVNVLNSNVQDFFFC